MKIRKFTKAWLISFAVTIFVLGMGGHETGTIAAGIMLLLGLLL